MDPQVLINQRCLHVEIIWIICIDYVASHCVFYTFAYITGLFIFSICLDSITGR